MLPTGSNNRTANAKLDEVLAQDMDWQGAGQPQGTNPTNQAGKARPNPAGRLQEARRRSLGHPRRMR